MKKHLIAAAVAAAVAVPAMAQNVTLGGVLDFSPHSERTTSVGGADVKTTGTGNDMAAGHAASSRINMTFGEDLGGGLRVDGLYRLRFTAPGGTGADDDTFLRLTGGFGSLRFGRFTGHVGNVEGFTGALSTTNTAGSIGQGGSNFLGGDIFLHATGITDGTGAITGKAAAQVATRTGTFDDTRGLVQYVSPSFSGMTLTLDYSNRKQDNSSANDAGSAVAKQTGVGLSYAAGPLQLQASSARKEVANVIGTEEDQNPLKGSVDWVAGTYDFGMVRVYGGTAQRKEKTAAGATQDDVRLNFIGVQVPVGAVTLFASMYDGADKNTGVEGVLATEKRDLSGNQLGVRYALSKRTFAYAVTGKNEDKGTTANTNYKKEETAIGLVHNF